MINGAVSGGFAGITYFIQDELNITESFDGVDNHRSQTYTYDYLQRITSAVTTGTSGANCWGQGFGSGGYSYDDRYSNMSQMTVSQCSAGSLDEAITSTTNQFTGFAYDSSGNETGGIGTQTYDAENRMTTSGYPGFTLTNAFDALNLKITKTRSDGLYPKMYWRDIWGNTLSESDSSGHMLNDYIYFAGKRIAYVTNTGSTYFYLTDQIGSVRKIADQNGNVCYDADYTPYGQQIYVAANSCPAQPYLFAGMERDDNVFDYDFARYYSSRLGRFMSADPLGGDIDNPQSLNRYTYVENNPINLTDPSGLWKYPCISKVEPGCIPSYADSSADWDGSWGFDEYSGNYYPGFDDWLYSDSDTGFADVLAGGSGDYTLWQGIEDGSGCTETIGGDCVLNPIPTPDGLPMGNPSNNGNAQGCFVNRVLAAIPGSSYLGQGSFVGGHQQYNFSGPASDFGPQGLLASDAFSAFGTIPNGYRIGGVFQSIHINGSGGLIDPASFEAHEDMFNPATGLFGAFGHLLFDMAIGHMPGAHLDGKC